MPGKPGGGFTPSNNLRQSQQSRRLGATSPSLSLVTPQLPVRVVRGDNVPATISSRDISGGLKQRRGLDGEERQPNKKRKFRHSTSTALADMADNFHVISDDEDTRLGTLQQPRNTTSVGRRYNAPGSGMKRSSAQDTTGAVSKPTEFLQFENMIRSRRTRSNVKGSLEYPPHFPRNFTSMSSDVEVVKRRAPFDRMDDADNIEDAVEESSNAKIRSSIGNQSSKRSSGSGSDLQLLTGSTETKRRKVQALQSRNGAWPEKKTRKVGISDLSVFGVESDLSPDDELATTNTISRVNNRPRRRVNRPETNYEIEIPETPPPAAPNVDTGRPETPSPAVPDLENDIPASEVNHDRPPGKGSTTTKNRLKVVGSPLGGKDDSFGLNSLFTSDQEFQGPELSLGFKGDRRYYEIRRNGSPIDGAPHICPDELHKAEWRADDFHSTKVKLSGVRMEGLVKMFYLDFERHDDVKDFLSQMKSVGFTFQIFSRDKIDSIFANRPKLPVRRESHPAVDRGVEDRLLERNLAKNQTFPRYLRRISQMQVQPKDGYAATHFKSLKRTDGAPSENSLATPKHHSIFDELNSLGPELPKRKTRSSTTATGGSPPIAEKFSVARGLGPEWEQPVVYPVNGKKKTYVEFGDLYRLDEGQFLNDNLIEFYFRWLQETKKTRDNEVYFFGTHFYSSLTSEKRGSINHGAVARWTAKVDIFNYDFVIVPVNESAHWYLALICNLPNLKRSFSVEDSPPSELKVGLENVLKAASRPTGDATTPSGQNMSKSNSEPTLERQYADLNLDGDGLATRAPSREVSPEVQVRGSAAEISLVEDSSDSSISNRKKRTAQKSPEPKTQVRNQNGIFNLTKLNGTPPKRGKAKSIPRKYDTQEPIITILDSLGVSHSQTISNLKDYIIAEAKAKRGMEILKSDLKGCNLRIGIPQQNNFCDCGLYLCGYVHKFMENPRRFGKMLLAQEFDLETDWPDMDPDKMRAGVRDMLQQFAKEQAEQRKLEKEAKRLAKRGGAAPPPPTAKDGPRSEKSVDPTPEPVHDPRPLLNADLNIENEMLAEREGVTRGGGDSPQDQPESSLPELSSVPQTPNAASPDEMLLNGTKEHEIPVLSPQSRRAIRTPNTEYHATFSRRGSSPIIYPIESSPESSKETTKLLPDDLVAVESPERKKRRRSRTSQIVDEYVTELDKE